MCSSARRMTPGRSGFARAWWVDRAAASGVPPPRRYHRRRWRTSRCSLWSSSSGSALRSRGIPGLRARSSASGSTPRARGSSTPKNSSISGVPARSKLLLGHALDRRRMQIDVHRLERPLDRPGRAAVAGSLKETEPTRGRLRVARPSTVMLAQADPPARYESMPDGIAHRRWAAVSETSSGPPTDRAPPTPRTTR